MENICFDIASKIVNVLLYNDGSYDDVMSIMLVNRHFHDMSLKILTNYNKISRDHELEFYRWMFDTYLSTSKRLCAYPAFGDITLDVNSIVSFAYDVHKAYYVYVKHGSELIGVIYYNGIDYIHHRGQITRNVVTLPHYEPNINSTIDNPYSRTTLNIIAANHKMMKSLGFQ